jgi:cell division protein FtsB
MWKKIQERTLPFIIALSALSVSVSAAFYSVSGLSKLFAGASLEVIIMASSLEVAKLVIASLLYQYRKTLPKLLKYYLTIAAVVLILITSMGIYGFLSAAYQETASKAGNIEAQITLLETKRDNYTEQLAGYSQEKESLNQSISDLRAGLAGNKIQYKDRETGQIITTTSSSTRKALQKELNDAVTSRDLLGTKLERATDSITSIELKVLDVESNSEITSELGPLKYISELTNVPMGNVVNILMLIIIFVFDPLAISLVIAANFAFDRIRDVKKTDTPKKVVKEDFDENDENGLEKVLGTELNDVVNELTNEDIDELKEPEINKKTPINPTEQDIEKLRQSLENIENSKKNTTIEEVKVEDVKTPQIKTLRYQPRNANRNTRIDRI